MHHLAVLFPFQGMLPPSSSTIVLSFLFYTLDIRFVFSLFHILYSFFYTLYILLLFLYLPLLLCSSTSMPLGSHHTIYSSTALQR